MYIEMRARAASRGDETVVRSLLAGAITLLSSLCMLAGAAAQAKLPLGPAQCGPIENAYGPFDYRTNKRELKVVEDNHFTPNIENLRRGLTGSLGQELSYTLRAYPNHHRALISMMNLGEKLKTQMPPDAGVPVECWFERALRFRPNDNIARLLYATFLVKQGREADVVHQLEDAAKLAGDNAFTHYNIALVYFDLKHFDKSLAHAHISYGMGMQRPELREQLKRVDKWREPVDATAQGAAVGASDPVPSGIKN